MENVIGAIVVIVITGLIIVGLNSLFFHMPADIKRIANALEMIANRLERISNDAEWNLSKKF